MVWGYENYRQVNNMDDLPTKIWGQVVMPVILRWALYLNPIVFAAMV